MCPLLILIHLITRKTPSSYHFVLLVLQKTKKWKTLALDRTGFKSSQYGSRICIVIQSVVLRENDFPTIKVFFCNLYPCVTFLEYFRGKGSRSEYITHSHIDITHHFLASINPLVASSNILYIQFDSYWLPRLVSLINFEFLTFSRLFLYFQ